MLQKSLLRRLYQYIQSVGSSKVTGIKKHHDKKMIEMLVFAEYRKFIKIEFY